MKDPDDLNTLDMFKEDSLKKHKENLDKLNKLIQTKLTEVNNKEKNDD